MNIDIFEEKMRCRVVEILTQVVGVDSQLEVCVHIK